MAAALSWALVEVWPGRREGASKTAAKKKTTRFDLDRMGLHAPFHIQMKGRELTEADYMRTRNETSVIDDLSGPN
jgi:hypothetical protein